MTRLDEIRRRVGHATEASFGQDSYWTSWAQRYGQKDIPPDIIYLIALIEQSEKREKEIRIETILEIAKWVEVQAGREDIPNDGRRGHFNLVSVALERKAALLREGVGKKG